MKRKGIILAGGTGSRLHPSTISVSKQLMPVFDKPMIYYPLTVLMEAGLDDILVITTPGDKAAFQTLLKDGTQWGMNIDFAAQDNPDGLAQALIIAEDWLDGAPSALILGDNLFFGQSFSNSVRAAALKPQGATVFGYRVRQPEHYGVLGFDNDGMVTSITEKPDHPKSEFAVTGLYFYDAHAGEYARSITPSTRGELEITDLNEIYLKKGLLDVELLGDGTTWLDTGTHRSLFSAAQFVSVIEERQGRRICCPEVVAFEHGRIDAAQLRALAAPLEKSGYGKYLLKVLEMDAGRKRQA